MDVENIEREQIKKTSLEDAAGEILWYVLKAANKRALKVKEELRQKNVQSFVPMHKTQITNRNGVKKIVDAPIFSTLIFIKSTLQQIREINQSYPYLYYQYNKVDGKNILMTVPTQQMERFINFIDGNEANVQQVDFDDLDLKKGEKVRITSGVFEGKTAVLVKVKGKRNKQIVVTIDGILAIMATASFTVERVSSSSDNGSER